MATFVVHILFNFRIFFNSKLITKFVLLEPCIKFTQFSCDRGIIYNSYCITGYIWKTFLFCTQFYNSSVKTSSLHIQLSNSSILIRTDVNVVMKVLPIIYKIYNTKFTYPKNIYVGVTHLKHVPDAELSRYVENQLKAFGSFLFFGRFVVSLKNFRFQFPN